MDIGTMLMLFFFALPFLYYQYRVTDWAYDTYSIAYVWHWRSPPRLTVPFYGGSLLFLCATLYALYALVVPGTNPHIGNTSDLISLMVRLVALTGLMVAKGYFGPAVAGYVCASVATVWLTTGDLEIPRLFDLAVGALLGPGWDQLQIGYTLFITGNGLLSPLIGFDDAIDVVAQ